MNRWPTRPEPLTPPEEANRIHKLLSWPPFFQAVAEGRKRFEIRKDDREPRFRVGDYLVLCEYNPQTERYSGKQLTVRVTYLSASFVPEGHVVMSIEPWVPTPAAAVGAARVNANPLGTTERAPDHTRAAGVVQGPDPRPSSDLDRALKAENSNRYFQEQVATLTREKNQALLERATTTEAARAERDGLLNAFRACHDADLFHTMLRAKAIESDLHALRTALASLEYEMREHQTTQFCKHHGIGPEVITKWADQLAALWKRTS